MLPMSETVHAIIKELRRRLEALYGPRLVRMVLYGSQARGDAAPDSDIDVLVVLKGTVSPCEEIARTSEIVAELSLQYNEVVCCIFMEEKRFRHRYGPLLRNIRKEGITV